jgi:hypothetical protein
MLSLHGLEAGMRKVENRLKNVMKVMVFPNSDRCNVNPLAPRCSCGR